MIRVRRCWLLLVCVFIAPAPISAQTAEDSIRASLRLPEPPAMQAPALIQALLRARTAPSMSASSPTAFGAGLGDVFAGAGYQFRARYVDGDDGAAAIGIGLGDASRLVGVDVTVITFSTFRSGWGQRVGVDVKVHRTLRWDMAVAAGWESVRSRGYNDGGSNRYAVISKNWLLRESTALFSGATLSLGAGRGRFQDEASFRAGENGIGVFASAAVRVAPSMSVIVDWTGQDAMVAVSVAPFRGLPFAAMAGLTDVTGRAGDGSRVVAAAGFGFNVCSLLSC
jgi:hypothetical protein